MDPLELSQKRLAACRRKIASGIRGFVRKAHANGVVVGTGRGGIVRAAAEGAASTGGASTGGAADAIGAAGAASTLAVEALLSQAKSAARAANARPRGIRRF